MLPRDTTRSVVFEKFFKVGFFDWFGSRGLDFGFGPTITCESQESLFWYFSHTSFIVR